LPVPIYPPIYTTYLPCWEFVVTSRESIFLVASVVSLSPAERLSNHLPRKGLWDTI
jgi:hypothetical protein